MSQLPEPAFPLSSLRGHPRGPATFSPLLSLSASIPLSRWSSDGAGESRARGRGPRKPPGLRGEVGGTRLKGPRPLRPARESPRRQRPGPRPLRVPAAARGDRRGGPGGGGRRRCVPRLPKADQIGSSAREPRLPARRPSAPPEPPPEEPEPRGLPGRGAARPPGPPPLPAPAAPPPAAGPGSAAVGDRGEEGSTVRRAAGCSAGERQQVVSAPRPREEGGRRPASHVSPARGCPGARARAFSFPLVPGRWSWAAPEGSGPELRSPPARPARRVRLPPGAGWGPHLSPSAQGRLENVPLPLWGLKDRRVSSGWGWGWCAAVAGGWLAKGLSGLTPHPGVPGPKSVRAPSPPTQCPLPASAPALRAQTNQLQRKLMLMLTAVDKIKKKKKSSRSSLEW